MKKPWLTSFAAYMAVFYYVLLVATLVGCVSVPKFPGLHRPAISPASSAAADPAAAVTSAATAPPSVAGVVHSQAILFSVIGVALILGGVALCYFQFYIPAVKLFVAGVALPVVGIIWSQHYAIIIAAALVGLAIWFILAHYASVTAIIKEVGPDADLVLGKIEGLAGIAAIKAAPAPDAPVTLPAGVLPNPILNTAKPV